MKPETYDAIVIGGGAAGIGVGIAIRDAGITNMLVLERFVVGASFMAWPAETQFITPSFPTNSIGMLDLNSIAIGVSPAFTLEVEHPTGKAYAVHLHAVVKHFELPVREHTHVRRVSKDGDEFVIETDTETLRARHVVWAAGEFQFPRRDGFPGSKLCRHTATVASYGKLEGDDFIVIGGYESGVDAAYHLALDDRQVRLLDKGNPWETNTSDPSTALSTFSIERMRYSFFEEAVELLPYSPVASVTQADGGYEVWTLDEQVFHTPQPPLLASGFKGGLGLVADLFEFREDRFPLLSEQDESTRTPGLFLCGPMVRHDDHVFCFIYKFRQRFAVVAKAIATNLGLPAEGLEQYRDWGMYLDDLSCCGEECVC